mgnify:CR=1 FL=1
MDHTSCHANCDALDPSDIAAKAVFGFVSLYSARLPGGIARLEPVKTHTSGLEGNLQDGRRTGDLFGAWPMKQSAQTEHPELWRLSTASVIVHRTTDSTQPTPTARGSEMPTNVEIVKRFVSEVINQGRVATIAEIAQGDLVALTMIATGTHDGDLMGLAPTGATIELPMAIVSGFEDGQIVEEREYYDSATMMSQLGLDTA